LQSNKPQDWQNEGLLLNREVVLFEGEGEVEEQEEEKEFLNICNPQLLKFESLAAELIASPLQPQGFPVGPHGKAPHKSYSRDGAAGPNGLVSR